MSLIDFFIEWCHIYIKYSFYWFYTIIGDASPISNPIYVGKKHMFYISNVITFSIFSELI